MNSRDEKKREAREERVRRRVSRRAREENCAVESGCEKDRISRCEDVFENEKVAGRRSRKTLRSYTEKERKKREETSVAFERERARVFGVRGEPRMTLQTFRGGRHGNLSRFF